MIQTINIGTTANDGTGDTVRDSFDKVNDNFIEVSKGLYAQTALSVPVVYASGEASLVGAGVGSLTVPANSFKVGDSFTAKMCGKLSCANNQQIHFRVRSNGVVIIDALAYTLSTLSLIHI